MSSEVTRLEPNKRGNTGIVDQSQVKGHYCELEKHLNSQAVKLLGTQKLYDGTAGY